MKNRKIYLKCLVNVSNKSAKSDVARLVFELA